MMAKGSQVPKRQQYLVAYLLLDIKTCLVQIAGYPVPLKVLRGLDNLLPYRHGAIGRG